MTNRAKAKAWELRDRYRIGGRWDDELLAQAVADSGARLRLFPFAEGITEIVALRTIGVSSTVGPDRRRWLIAHGLWHWLADRGNHLICDGVIQAQQERHAELFAGYLLLGATYLAAPVWELAEHFGLADADILRFLRLVNGEALAWSA